MTFQGWDVLQGMELGEGEHLAQSVVGPEEVTVEEAAEEKQLIKICLVIKITARSIRLSHMDDMICLMFLRDQVVV